MGTIGFDSVMPSFEPVMPGFEPVMPGFDSHAKRPRM